MEPMPESRELLQRLWIGPGDEQLDVWLLARAQQVSALIPDCAGLTIALIGDVGLTFTFLATGDELRLVDGAQYLDGGPCEEAAHETNASTPTCSARTGGTWPRGQVPRPASAARCRCRSAPGTRSWAA